MQTLEFNTHNQELKDISKSRRNLFRSLPFRGVGASELERRPVDRSKFFTNNEELLTAVKGLEIMLVERSQAADHRSVLKSQTSVLEPGETLYGRDLQAIIEADATTGTQLQTMVNRARTQRMRQAQSEDWWSIFADKDYFSHNVFQADPTEQIIIGRDQIEPVTIYNFGEKLRKSHIEGVLGAVAAMSALTDGYTRAIVPYIVVHDAFLPQHFKQSGSTDRAAGRAWQGEPFIEARRSALGSLGAGGSVGQSWTSQLIAHEISHQIDEAASAGHPDFSSYFHYIDQNGDGLIDYVKPTKRFASAYAEHDIHASRPIKEYGYTNSTEDLATVGEEVPFGGHVDTLRRDAYLEVIEVFKEKGKKKYGEMQQLPTDLKVEIARGGEIQLPVAPALIDPIRIRVENADADSIGGLFKRLFGARS